MQIFWFHFTAEHHYEYVPIFIIHLSVEVHLGLFLFPRYLERIDNEHDWTSISVVECQALWYMPRNI